MTIQKLKQDVIPDPTLVDVDTIQLPAATITVGGKQYNTSTLTMDMDASGAGGLDTGARAADTLYYLYAVLDSGVVKLIASTNSSLPTGFTFATSVGKFRTFVGSDDIAAVSSQIVNTEWELFTPHTTQGFGVVSNLTLEWRRSKSEIQIRGGFNAGTTVASVALMGVPNAFSLSFKSAGQSSEEVLLGYAFRDATSNTFFSLLGFQGEAYFRFGRYNRSADENLLGSTNGSVILSTGQRVSIIAAATVAEFADLY